MCGRYVLSTPGEVLAELFELPAAPELAARYNIAPTQTVPIVRAGASGGRELAFVSWGLVPFWAKERAIGNRLINARAESASEKPSFRDPLKRHRCLIPADGFYEWRKLEGGKQPYLLRLRGGAPFGFAGLWSRWQDPASGEPFESCAILTTRPNALAAEVHDRMPVILPRAAHGTWLDPALTDPTRLASLMTPYPAEEMESYPVGRRVNSPANDDPSLVQPLAAS